MRMVWMKSLLCLIFASSLVAAPYPEKTPDTPGNRMLQGYWERQVREIEQTGGLKDIQTAEDWKSKAPVYRQQLAEMLETDVAGGSLEKVMQAYEKAAEWYTAEESKAYVLDFSFCFFCLVFFFCLV